MAERELEAVDGVICVPPFRGEFGITVRYHVPAVHALASPKVVCIEQGMEALYPGCEHVFVERKADLGRRATYAGDRAFVARWKRRLGDMYPGARIVAPDRRKTWPEKRFVPEPHTSLVGSPEKGPPDVVVCPRKREHEPEKNWPHWPKLTAMLQDAGLFVAAAGAPGTSADVPCLRAWTGAHGRPLDMSIEMMRRTRLVIATDAGLAHLAVLCGRPLLMVTADGRPCPGYPWKVRWEEYYASANWMDADIRMLDGWEDPQRVAELAIRMMGTLA